MRIDASEIRNHIRVWYGPLVLTRVERAPETLIERMLARFGRRPYEMRWMRGTVEVRDNDSLARYGQRLLVVEGEADWTLEKAQELANRTLRDLSKPAQIIG